MGRGAGARLLRDASFLTFRVEVFDTPPEEVARGAGGRVEKVRVAGPALTRGRPAREGEGCGVADPACAFFGHYNSL